MDDEGRAELAERARRRGRPGEARSARADGRPVADPSGGCRYLHAATGDPACLAIAPAIHLGPRQVDLVCAGSTHAACPRFARGRAAVSPPPPIADRANLPAAATAAAPPVIEPVILAAAVGSSTALATGESEPVAAPREAPDPRVRGALPTTRSIVARPATIAAALTFVVTLAAAIAFLDARGGLALLPARTSPSVVVVAPSPSAAPPTASPFASVGPSPTAAPPSGVVTPPSAAPPTAVAVATPSFPGSSLPPDLVALLIPCPDGSGCSQYRIRSGDTLSGVATLFGVSYQAMIAANPGIANPSLIHVGQLVTVPIPH
ncbi:MAG: LysM peptidoglycan-binding domain-containing protein [Candidatus Limnocylindrales bacterium]